MSRQPTKPVSGPRLLDRSKAAALLGPAREAIKVLESVRDAIEGRDSNEARIIARWEEYSARLRKQFPEFPEGEPPEEDGAARKRHRQARESLMREVYGEECLESPPSTEEEWARLTKEEGARIAALFGSTEEEREGFCFAVSGDWRAPCLRLAKELALTGFDSESRAIRREAGTRLPEPIHLDPGDHEHKEAWRRAGGADALRAAEKGRVERVLAVLLPLVEDLGQRGAASGRTTGKRTRKRPPLSAKPLTSKQAEAVQIVGECRGSYAEAARKLGIDRKTVKQHYLTAMKKMGKTVIEHATQRIPTDRRGQEFVADEEDRRRP